MSDFKNNQPKKKPYTPPVEEVPEEVVPVEMVEEPKESLAQEVKPVAEETWRGRVVVVSTTDLPLRRRPNNTSTMIGKFVKGTQLKISADQDGYGRVVPASGESVGWVFLKNTKPLN